MAQSAVTTVPAFKVVVELLKPITWFAPMWAFCCGVARPMPVRPMGVGRSSWRVCCWRGR